MKVEVAAGCRTRRSATFTTLGDLVLSMVESWAIGVSTLWIVHGGQFAGALVVTTNWSDSKFALSLCPH